jgi:glyoxylase-like metal-dependent hydrolase (beta-lactamase superfamily II)
MRYPVVEGNLLVEEQYDLNPLGFNAYIMHTPGHTVGSISVIVDHEIAIVGDAMFGVFRNSVFPPFISDTQAMVRSWKKLLDTGCEIYLPSHGREIPRELLHKEYVRYQKKFGV